MENIDPTLEHSNTALRYYYIFKISTVMAPLLPIYLGYRLFILGVSGDASLIVESDTLDAQLINAAPGLILSVSGVAALIFVIVKGVKVTYADSGLIAACNDKPLVSSITDEN
jgi:hypothetical protein